MRTITLRAWESKLKTWHYFQLPTAIFVAPNGMSDGLAYTNWCESTGLLDRNGKEIYEGDIINYIFGPSEVKFDNGCYFVHGHPSTINIQPLGDLIARQCEVLGNIYENPELLESQDKGGHYDK